ncbi:Wzz/FepE/Etk N-terminal domain-containing protein [Pseudomonas aeruginosa]|uniref:Wzz/FepE/Etk N-terminal domain-containing protein n=1 Tax=Pseudomonas aeruginosa TaxID=287 RepID=UPI002000D424|nr:Wzz/FepE/Etk N-terminal domain-containing protein [Pseudomonas aeruginosa]UPL29121.1 Wzz/FepE/Etk N-terminal domain-containing protein [Pseudomonas aeruginosa]WME43908.1 Wzz/FepE/Etk N-terminal domain-containing protein [Pseudomonas aeruginosa]
MSGLWSLRWLIALLAVLPVLLAIVYLFITKPVYEARVSTLPPSLSDIAGFNLGRSENGLPAFSANGGRPQKLSATPDHFGKVLPHVLSRTQRHRARHDPDRPVQWLQPAQACPADEPQPLDGQP